MREEDVGSLQNRLNTLVGPAHDLTMRRVIDLHRSSEDISTILCTTRGLFEVTTNHKMVLESTVLAAV